MELVTVRVGKNGVTKELIEEINLVLKKRKTVRLKMLRSAVQEKDRRQVMDEIKKKTKCRTADIRGRIVILKK